MRSCLLFSSVLFCLELTLRVSGRHRHGLIAECNKCAPGELLWKRCSRYHDSLCLPCPPGTYQPHHSYKQQCYLCSKCGDGLYVAHDCKPNSDTVCDSCHTYKGPHNLDYQRRCQFGLETRKSVPPESWKNYQSDEVKNQQKFLLILSSAVVLTFVCCVTFFLLADRWCKNDKIMKMGYTYQSVNTEPAIL